MSIYKSKKYATDRIPFDINKEFLKAGYKLNIHQHEFIELVYIISGKSVQYIDSKAYDVCSGDMVFVNYKQTHSYYLTEDTEFYTLLIKPEYISEKICDAETIYDVFSFFIMGDFFNASTANEQFVKIPIKHKSEMYRLVKSMYEETLKGEAGLNLALDGYMKLIFSRIIQSLRQNEQNTMRNTIISELLDYIDRNYTKTITLPEIASHCFYNGAYLSKIFKTEFNISLKEYIANKRVEYACSLLETTDLTVENIALKVGYSEKTHFHRVFKEKTGCTPSQFRKSSKNL